MKELLQPRLKQGGEGEGFIKGVEMILKQFKETLNGMGVEEIPAVGEVFNPHASFGSKPY